MRSKVNSIEPHFSFYHGSWLNSAEREWFPSGELNGGVAWPAVGKLKNDDQRSRPVARPIGVNDFSRFFVLSAFQVADSFLPRHPGPEPSPRPQNSWEEQTPSGLASQILPAAGQNHREG